LGLDYTDGCVNFRDVGEYTDLITGEKVFSKGLINQDMITHKNFIHIIGKYFGLIILVSILFFFSSCSHEEDKPNIIFILADDLGYGDLGCYGHPYAKTPNIDKLAMEGARFNRFYSAAVTCNPSRTALMTSRYPASFEQYTDLYGFGDRVSITELLNQEGYITAHIGKWHIGPVKRISKNTIIVENSYGIDDIKLNPGLRDPSMSKDESLFSYSIDFIERNKNRPFYINIWTHTCHYPLRSPEHMQQLFKDLDVDHNKFGKWFNENKIRILEENGKDINEALGMYLADVYSLDYNIGRLMQCLEEQGLEQNTIIIFSSDQGPASVLLTKAGIQDKNANMRLSMLGYSGGLRGSKHDQHEGGIRVPFIIKWPQKIPANYVDEQSVISGLDYLPSICSILGIDIDQNNFDGRDKSHVWYGTPEKREEALYWKRPVKNATISILDHPWKLHKVSADSVELYNLESDPFEEDEVSSENQSIVKDLLIRIDQWNDSLPSHPVRNNPPRKVR